jgi:dienelactone hydrolase
MHRYEWLMTVAMLPALACLLPLNGPTGWPLWLGALGATPAVLALLYGWRKGAHWQMWPGYVGITLVLAVEGAKPGAVWARLVCAMLALLPLSALASYVLLLFQVPHPTGRYPVGTRMLYVMDGDREEMHAWAHPGKREAVVQLWYPAASRQGRRAKYRQKKETTSKSAYQRFLYTPSFQDAAMAAGRFPVIVHNPGWHGTRQRASFLTEELASHGYVVAAVSHPYNSSFVVLSDGRLAPPNYDHDIGFSMEVYIPLDRRLGMAEEELLIQTRDCRVVLDELERLNGTVGHPLAGHLQMDCVGCYGHSFGGAVCAELAKEDARVRSVLELDGVMHGESAKSGPEKPLMLIDTLWMANPHAEREVKPKSAVPAETTWRETAYEETVKMWGDIAKVKGAVLERNGGIRVVVAGMSHVDFIDQIFMSPTRRFSKKGEMKPKRVAEILRAYMLAFFEQTLRGVSSPLLTGKSQLFAETAVEIWEGHGAAVRTNPSKSL